MYQAITSAFYFLLGKEINAIVRFYGQLIYWSPLNHDKKTLFHHLENDHKKIGEKIEELTTAIKNNPLRTAIVLNGHANYSYDIQKILIDFRPHLRRDSRLFLVSYNPYFEWIFALANKMGLRQGPLPTTFVTRNDLNNLAKLAGYEIVRSRFICYLPLPLGRFGAFLNSLLSAIPLVRVFSLAHLSVLRPIIKSEKQPMLSIVIPARNERGNIEFALKRLESFDIPKEIIFVEGHSSDGTWEEIERVAKVYQDKFSIQTMRQTGKGKNDAVRLGFSRAKGELLTILDADLTMPPELLHRFYDAYTEGLADFINGSRLVYPMEGEAMRFLNRLGNIFFAKALSVVLECPLTDTLCGTKLISREDYALITRWRKDFGDFDPFGDFELIFPSAILCLGIVDIPIRYRDRTYGSTNISRFRHGFMLLRMTLIGLFRIRLRS